jgi:hypothetical protein
MLQIRYSAPRDLDISGSAAELRRIAEGILAFLGSNRTGFALVAGAGYDPSPYRIAISGLLVVKGGGRLALTVEAESLLRIIGAPEQLEILADWFLFDETTHPGEHRHFEYYEEHPFLAPYSLPLVICVD